MPMVEFEGLLWNCVWTVTAEEILDFLGRDTFSCVKQGLYKVLRPCRVAWEQGYEVRECIQWVLNYSHGKGDILLLIRDCDVRAMRGKPKLLSDIYNHILGHCSRCSHHGNPARDTAQKNVKFRVLGTEVIVSPVADAVGFIDDKRDEVICKEVAGKDRAVEFWRDSHFGTNERDAVFISSDTLWEVSRRDPRQV